MVRKNSADPALPALVAVFSVNRVFQRRDLNSIFAGIYREHWARFRNPLTGDFSKAARF